MPRFRQIDHQERVCIAYFLSEGCSQATIARYMERARSTIKREIERNGYRDARGKWRYDPHEATERWEQRKANVHYGRGRRTFYLRVPACIVDTPKFRNDKQQAYRFRFGMGHRTHRRLSTSRKDKLRTGREALHRRMRIRKPELFRTYTARFFPFPRKRKQIYRWWKYRRGRDRFNAKRKSRRWNCFWRTCWRFDKRKNRYRRAPYSYWPPGSPPLSVFLQDEQPKVSSKPFKKCLKQSFPKPESFGMAPLCPERSNFRYFSKNETLLGVDKSVLFQNPVIFS